MLANDQGSDGRGWRSGAVVETRQLTQWFLRITAYADRLIEGLETLDRWPDKVRLMQENWIGRSRGLRLRFDWAAPVGTHADPPGGEGVEVYTTRPDTLFGASFVAVAPEHPIAVELGERSPEAARFNIECRRGGPSEADLAGGANEGHGHFSGGVEAVEQHSLARLQTGRKAGEQAGELVVAWIGHGGRN